MDESKSENKLKKILKVIAEVIAIIILGIIAIISVIALIGIIIYELYKLIHIITYIIENPYFILKLIAIWSLFMLIIWIYDRISEKGKKETIM